MGRFLVFAGIVLVVGAVGFLVAISNGISTAFLEPLLGQLLCAGSETPQLTTSRFFCIGLEGEQRNVSEVVMFGSTIAIAAGIIMTVVGGIMGSQRTQAASFNFQSHDAQVFDLRDGGFIDGRQQVEIPEEAREVIQQVFTQIGQIAGTNTLAERLRQLEEARDQGLINQFEYERARQAILDNFDD